MNSSNDDKFLLTNENKDLKDIFKSVADLVLAEQERSYAKHSNLFEQFVLNFVEQPIDKLVPNEPDNEMILGEIYQKSDLNLLINLFAKEETVLNVNSVLRIIRDAKKLLESKPNINEVIMNDPQELGVIVVGDLHGSFNDLKYIIEKYGLPGPEKQHKYVFNGNIINSGPKQLECLLIILYAFINTPECVFLNRGSHEDCLMASSNAFKPSFLAQLNKKYSGHQSRLIFNECCDLFSHLPLATTITNINESLKCFVVSGGVSNRTDLNYINQSINRSEYKMIKPSKETAKSVKEQTDLQQLIDLLWSEPIRIEDGKVKPSCAKKTTGCYVNGDKNNFGSLFGIDVTSSFCKQNAFNFIIRGREVRAVNGYKEDQLRCYTLFSASGFYSSPYSIGAVLKISPRDSQLHWNSYNNNNTAQNYNVNDNKLIKAFKNVVKNHGTSLTERLRKYETESDGFVSLETFVDVLNNYFSSFLNITAVKFLYSNQMSSDKLNYVNVLNDDNEIDYNLIENLFELLDINNENKLDYRIAKEALLKINDKHDYVKFLENLITSNDQIDMKKFKNLYSNKYETNEIETTTNMKIKNFERSLSSSLSNLKFERSNSDRSDESNKLEFNTDEADDYYDSDETEEGDVEFLRI